MDKNTQKEINVKKFIQLMNRNGNKEENPEPNEPKWTQHLVWQDINNNNTGPRNEMQ